MEQKADRGGVCPLDVVQYQQQWLGSRYGEQHVGDLLEKITLFRRRPCPTTFDVFPQWQKPGSVLLPGRHRAGQKRPTWHKDIQ